MTSAMFTRLSKSRPHEGSRNSSRLSPQGDHDSHDDNENGSYNRSFGKLPSRNSLRASRSPPDACIHQKSLSLASENYEIPCVTPLYVNSDSDIDDNVSFAESLFPISPPVFSAHCLGRRSTESYFMSDSDYSPLTDSRGSKKSPLVHGFSKQIENGRRSVDMGNKKLGGSLHVDNFSILPIGERVSFNIEEHGTWEASSKRDRDPKELDKGARSWTASSMLEEEIDVGSAVLPPYDDAEDEFLEEFEGYFDNLHVDNVRQDQYPKLQLQNLVYLDYASCPLFSKFQVEEHSRIILAEGPCLSYTSVSSSLDNPLFSHVSETQHRLLSMLNTTSSNYSIIFTAGFQQSFRVLAESFPFRKGTPLLVCQDNHVAVRQVMQSAHRAGGRSVLSPVTEELCIQSDELHKLLRRQTKRNASNVGLFIYPAQSNVSGIKHSLKWIAEAQQNKWNVCLDVTTNLPSNHLDLSTYQPDFIVGSFQHIFGYPSGMGFLLVRRESFCVRALPSEAVQFIRNMAADEGEHCHILCPTDNTMNLLQFAALNLGFIQLERIGLSAIQKRVSSLMQWLVQRLCTLRHKNDDSRYLLRVYGSHANEGQGSIVTFNVIDLSGTTLPPHIVLKLAARCNIKLAIGNFNNPGLSYLLGDKPNERPKDVGIFEGNWGFMAVRASFGAVSNFSDVYRLLQFLSRFRDEEYLTTEAMGFIEESNLLQ
ncbi:uncharacterized protein [Physcomitrium patens]|uniref:Aminotransferase class V domain-containing protein n=1 Tax=Physcomitrium patens TaxID=3218 RepID=A0A2K1KH50_PHYPA|nr:molybdenum cofactor sulfurase-like [Physcomitrium patens]PNR53111.1 hypothetical protein PHYPA_009486 [Physcomitrium patens]|eukprot:XP_024377388.1 molybdenum cofactor sulfurase-like [Physcomitrella patens]